MVSGPLQRSRSPPQYLHGLARQRLSVQVSHWPIGADTFVIDASAYYLYLDKNGNTYGHAYTAVAVLRAVTGLSDEDALLASGNLVVS